MILAWGERQDPNTEEQFRGKCEREQEWVTSEVTVTGRTSNLSATSCYLTPLEAPL